MKPHFMQFPIFGLYNVQRFRFLCLGYDRGKKIAYIVNGTQSRAQISSAASQL